MAILLWSYCSFESKLTAHVRSMVPPKFQNRFHSHANDSLGMLNHGCTRGGGGVCHPPIRFFWVFSQRVKHQHLMFSGVVRSSLAQILRQVWWWSAAMVTKYDIKSSRWSSQFWVKIHVFSPSFNNKSKSSDKNPANRLFMCHLPCKAQKITISCGFILNSNSW